MRIILTEEPKGDAGLTKDLIMVENGSVVGNVTKGLTYKGGHAVMNIPEFTVDVPDPGTDVVVPAVANPTAS